MYHILSGVDGNLEFELLRKTPTIDRVIPNMPKR